MIVWLECVPKRVKKKKDIIPWPHTFCRYIVVREFLPVTQPGILSWATIKHSGRVMWEDT